MTYSHAKVHGQRSVGSEDRVETNGRADGRTEANALHPSLMLSVNVLVSEYKVGHVWVEH